MGKDCCLGGGSFSFLSLFCFEREKIRVCRGFAIAFSALYNDKGCQASFQKANFLFSRKWDDFQVTLHLKIRFIQNDL